MQQENNDMYELFRMAAENYPLRTDNADFEKVRAGLLAGNVTTDVVANKNRRGLWLLLLLLPLGWAGYNYIFNPAPSNKSVAIKNDARANNNKQSQSATKQNNVTAVTEKSNQSNQHQSIISNSVPAQDVIQKNSNNVVVISYSKNLLTANYQSPGDKKSDGGSFATNDKSTINTTGVEDNKIQPVEKNNDDKKINEVSDRIDKVNKDVAITDVTKNDAPTSNKNKKQKDNFFYAGVFAGPDISNVKSQAIKNYGANMGIILGYQLNKKLSIETGLDWDKKYYYSDGQYFNTGKIYLPANTKIAYVDGNCKMIEIPLNIKYNFKSSGKATWFSVLGVSSYFMKQENYDYTIISTGQPYPYSKSYNQSSKFLLSALNVSAGYNRSLGKVAKLRVEPYVKIPLKGIGIGSLPITSVGVNIGITKKIF